MHHLLHGFSRKTRHPLRRSLALLGAACAITSATCAITGAAKAQDNNFEMPPQVAELPQVAEPPGPPKAAPQKQPTVPELKARLAKMEERVAHREIPVDPQNLALLRFKLEQVHLFLEQIDKGTSYFPIVSQRGAAFNLDRAESIGRAIGDAALPAPSPLHERAYLADNDGSPQPYWVFLPPNYSARNTYPVIVFLHGYSTDVSKIEPWLPGDETWRPATDAGYIFVVPYGRRNSDFVDVGEDDTLRVLAEVKQHYRIDESRQFLLGPSMGGFGVYTIGLHHPQMWAGLAPIAARSDFYLWFNLERDQVPPWKRQQYDADDPRHLAGNALHLPIFMQHGALDTIVPVDHSRRMAADLANLGYDFQYREVPNGNHNFYWESATYQSAIEWMQKVKPAPVPLRLTYTTGNLRNHRCYWADITSFEDYNRLAHLTAEIGTDNSIAVTLDNIGSFTLQPPVGSGDLKASWQLTVNGERQTVTPDTTGRLVWEAPGRAATVPAAADATLRKTAERCGPIKNCYRDPFLVVYGTLQTGNTGEPSDEATARHWVQGWQEFADGVPPLRADREVTAEDRQRYNLILFGTRASNSILAEIADRLPLELTANGYRIGEKQVKVATRADERLGLQLCYPSPFAPARMIVVQSGLLWGGALPLNHKFDLLPEYIVFDNYLDSSDKTNRALIAGFFDSGWQLISGEGTSAKQGQPAKKELEETPQIAP